MSDKPGIVLNGHNALPIARVQGTYTIIEAAEPLVGGIFTHNLWVLKDPFGNLVSELNGLPTNPVTGEVESGGSSGTDKLYVWESPIASRYNPSETQSVQFSGNYDQVIARWNSATSCGGAITSEGLSYPKYGAGTNSDAVASTVAVCMVLPESSSVLSYNPTPGIGSIILPNQTIQNSINNSGLGFQLGALGINYIPEDNGYYFFNSNSDQQNFQFASYTTYSDNHYTIGSGNAVVSWTDRNGITVSAPATPQQATPPAQPNQTSLNFAQIASAFGSTLGRLVGGSNLIIGTAAGTVISTVALSVGATLFPGAYRSQATVAGSASEGTGSVWSDFGNNLGQFGVNATIGSATSYLAAEFAQSVGLTGFAGQAFDAVAGNVLQYVATKALASTSVGALLHIHAPGSLGGSLQSGIAGFLGAELASLVVTPHTVAESTLASLGSAVASVVAASNSTLFGLIGLPGGPLGIGIAAFVGFILGDLIGSLFGHHKPRIPTASAETVLQIPYAQYALGTETSANGGDLQLADAMAKAARDALNGLIAQITHSPTPAFVANTVSPTQAYGVTGSQIYVKLAGVQNNVSSANQAVDKGVLWALPQTKIIGGDIILKRAVQNGVWSTVTEMLGDLQIASDYETYLKSKPVIDAAIGSSWNGLSATDQTFYTGNKAFMTRAISASQLPLTGADITFYNANKAQVDHIVSSISVSSFAAGWIVTLARAAELKLDQFGPSDFFGGLQGFLQSFNLNSTGTAVHYEDVSLHQNMGNLAVSIAGNAAPGTFSLLPTAINGPSDQDLFNPRFQQGATGYWNGTWNNASTNGATSIPGWTAYNSDGSAFTWGDNLNSDWSGSGNDVLWIDKPGTPVAGTYTDVWSDPIASTAGTTYEASVYAAQHRGAAQMYMIYMAGDGTWLGVSQASGAAREGGSWHGDISNYNQLSVTSTAPVGTVQRKILLRDYATGGGDPYAFFTRPETHQAGANPAYQGNWDSAGQSVQIASFAASAGYNITTPGGITNGNDLIIAPANGQPITVSAGSPAISLGQYGYVPATNGGDDIIIGGFGADNLSAGAGNVWIDGGAGNDVITGGAGRDVLLGGAGNDTITTGSGDTYLSGGAGNDTLIGGAGNDTFVGGAGSNVETGGAGNDVFIIAQHSDGGGDRIDGGAGSNTVSFERWTAGVIISLTGGTQSINGDLWTNTQNLTGSNFNDTLTAASGGSVLRGLDGNDLLNGSLGNDTLEGGVGADILNGGGGFNTASYANSSAGVYVNLATGTTIGGDATGDVLSNIQNLTGSAYGDELAGDGNINIINAGAGDDWLDATAGADTYNGGDGFDTVDYSGTSFVAGSSTVTYYYNGVPYTYTATIPAVAVNLAAGTVTVRNPDGSTASQAVSGIEQFIGSNGNDSFSSAGTSLNVTWDGGAGTDTASGGSGSDTYVYGRGYGNLTITDSNAASNTIKFKAGVTFDDLWGNYSSGSLQIGIRGQANFASITSNFVAGNDVIKTLDLAGAAQVDLTQIQGVNVLSDGNDTFNGSTGFSRLIFANNGNDTINPFTNAYSTSGSIIDGGLGDDTIVTSAGDDQFLFERGDGHDTITDGGGQNTIVFGPTVGSNDVIYEVVGNDLYVGIKDLTNVNLTASHVADNIKIVGGGVQYVGIINPANTYWSTNFSVEAGGATTDLTKANIAWTKTPYYDGGTIFPIVLDLNNDGLEITPVSQSDIITKDAAGNLLRTSWVGPTNGILAVDYNGDGNINNTADISFVSDKAGATTDLEGLSGWDTNGDGVLDSQDTNFSKLVVWVDANQDGRAEKNEVSTLAQLGIASINLAPKPTGFTSADTIDTVVSNTTTFTRSDGTTGIGYDVAIARQLLSGPATTSDATAIDPNAIGTFGQLQNDPLTLAKTNAVSGNKLTNKSVAALAKVDISDKGGIISSADAARWADFLDPAKDQARKDLLAKGGDSGAFLNTIRSTTAYANGSSLLTGRGVRDPKTRLQALVVDFNRDGPNLIDPTKSSVLIDMANSGTAAQVGWVSQSDGVLAIDRNGDGTVNPATELSFVNDVPNVRTSLQGLAAFDTNGDGILSSADSSFTKFLIWRDSNGNGISDPGETQSLAQAGVKDLRLDLSQVRPDRGVGATNDVLGVSQIDFTDGSSRALYDVALGFADSKDQTASQSPTPSNAGAAASLLQATSSSASSAANDSPTASNPAVPPNSQGSGAIASVGQARGALSGPSGAVVQSTSTNQDNGQWWRDATVVGTTLADLASPLPGNGNPLASNASSIASAPSADAATLQRLMLLRQTMAGQGGSLGGDAAVWARGGATDGIATLATSSLNPLAAPKALPVAA